MTYKEEDFPIPWRDRERIKRSFEMVEKGEELRIKELAERLEKIAPKEWLKNDEFTMRRAGIEQNIDEIKDGISLCDCSKTMEAVHLATSILCSTWDDIYISELSPKDKHILIKDLQNIDQSLKNELIPMFNRECTCKSSIIT